MKPSKEKLTTVKIKKEIITMGYCIFRSTKRLAVPKIIPPIKIAFVAAAPMYPIIISDGEIGADKIS